MAAPGTPVILPVAGAAARYSLTFEISQTQLAQIDAVADFLLEVGSSTPAGFTNAVRYTISRIPPVPPA